MRYSAVTLLTISLLISVCSAFSGDSQKETAAEKKRKLDRSHTAIMSRGTYSSPMSWDRKTTILTEEGKAVAEEIYSPNKKYYAFADFTSGQTTVFEIVGQGSIGRQVKLWSMQGCHEMLGLSSDGNSLVLGLRAEDRSIRDSDSDQVILTFIGRGHMIREVRMAELGPVPTEMTGTHSSNFRGRYRRLNAAGYYIVETRDEAPVLFDPERGERLGIKLDEMGDIDGWRRHIDVFNWFEFQYPGGLKLRQNRNLDGYPTGEVRLVRGETGWDITTTIEKIVDYRRDENSRSAFIEFAVDRVKVMNQADGPTSSRYVDRVISQAAFTNPHGVEMLELFLSLVRAEWTEEEEKTIERSTRGPIYAVLLAPCADEPRRVLFVSPADGADQQVGSDDLLKRIVNTIKYPDLKVDGLI